MAVNKEDLKKNSLLYFLSFGHGLKHIFSSSVQVLIPFIKESFSLSGVQIGSLVSANSIAAGLINVPAGLLTDLYKKKAGLIISSSAFMLFLGFLMVSFLSESNWVVLGFLSFIILGSGANLWHPPAFAVLSSKYPEKKAYALGVHLSAASAGNALGPLITGSLLSGIVIYKSLEINFNWKELAFLMAILCLILSLIVFLFSVKISIESSERLDFQRYFSKAVQSLKRTEVITMVSLHAIRQSVHSAFTVYFLIYLKETLNLTPLSIGFHFSLIGISGVIFTPLWGHISDRVGRLPIITLGMLLTSLFIYLIRFSDSGISLIILLLLLGCVLFAIIPVIAAAAMDYTVPGTEGTSVSLLFTGGAILGSLSPIIAGLFYDLSGFGSVIILTSLLALIGCVISLFAWVKFK
ncbi:MAG: hypothetical protein CL907_00745 [Dehalococcoidia bacterium]|nr:hypothetical protein [Dehalococcoidia bacterium]